MRVWIIKTGEPIPPLRPADRWMRSGNLARYLAAAGHRVTWWVGDFDHYSKTHFFGRNHVMEVDSTLTLHFVTSPGYRKHLSPRRFIDHRVVARSFRRWASREPVPDVVLCCLPTLDLCQAALDYGEVHKVPVVIDVRDWWPDIFYSAIPPHLQRLGRFLLTGLEKQANNICARASAIIGTTPGYVAWGLRRAGREARQWDRHFHLASTDDEVPDENVREQLLFWAEQGVERGRHEAIVCYIGSLGHSFDLIPAIQSARHYSEIGRRVLFVLCGRGDREQIYREASGDLPNVLIPGWLSASQLRALTSMCFAGISPLPDRSDLVQNVNNKTIQYLSAGLPVICSPPRGVVHDLVTEHQCGIGYATGDSVGLSQAISRYLNDRALHQQHAANALQLYLQEFNPERIYSAMVAYVEEVATAVRAGTG